MRIPELILKDYLRRVVVEETLKYQKAFQSTLKNPFQFSGDAHALFQSLSHLHWP